ncbi:hypothetical protein E2C01_062374 [Portunus trituberculatus]|uniref:Uncharacterized protein n=1 Tax=Portunus trituberculatus TaxID=210409 RepID=A0A5B7HFW0_PORTR|nr:hypothetical protein [Portunus trituberculatus]
MTKQQRPDAQDPGVVEGRTTTIVIDHAIRAVDGCLLHQKHEKGERWKEKGWKGKEMEYKGWRRIKVKERAKKELKESEVKERKGTETK